MLISNVHIRADANKAINKEHLNTLLNVVYTSGLRIIYVAVHLLKITIMS